MGQRCQVPEWLWCPLPTKGWWHPLLVCRSSNWSVAEASGEQLTVTEKTPGLMLSHLFTSESQVAVHRFPYSYTWAMDRSQAGSGAQNLPSATPSSEEG